MEGRGRGGGGLSGRGGVGGHDCPGRVVKRRKKVFGAHGKEFVFSGAGSAASQRRKMI